MKISYIMNNIFAIYAKKNLVVMIKKYYKVRDHNYRGAAHNICNLRYKAPKKIPVVVFHNGSKYDYHFIIKELAEKFEGQFQCS